MGSEPTCDDDGSCCPIGTTPVLGTANADVFFGSTQGQCYVGLGGNDVVADSSPAGLHAGLGGPGNDTLRAGLGPAILAGGDGNDTIDARDSDDELYGQSGDDTLNAGGGADIVEGGAGDDVIDAGDGDDDVRGDAGDDTIDGGGGADILVGGSGVDVVYGGSGDDLVVVFDVCELEPGEILAGDGGTDTLQIPVPLADVEALGVVVDGFENIIVDDTMSSSSACASCACFIDNGELVCCGGNGTCDEAVGNDKVVCDCDPGFGGGDCAVFTELSCAIGLLPQCLFETDDPQCSVDPASAWTHEDCYIREFDFEIPGTTQRCLADADCTCIGRVAYPSEPSSPQWVEGSETFPVVVLAHGNGQAYGQYDHVLQSLALNGIVAISIDTASTAGGLDIVNNIEARANVVINCLKGIFDPTVQENAGTKIEDQTAAATWDVDDLARIEPNIGLFGHSRGGGAVQRAARVIAQSGGVPPAVEGNINAMLLLAPRVAESTDDQLSPPGDFVPDEEQRIVFSHTKSLLVMVGGRDMDTRRQAFIYYDAAGEGDAGEASFGVGEERLTKAMVYVREASHNGFTLHPAGTTTLTQTTQQRILRSYSIAFFRWQLGADSFYKGFISGERASVSVENVEPPPDLPTIVPQFVQGSRVVLSGGVVNDVGGARVNVQSFQDLGSTELASCPAPFVCQSGAMTTVDEIDQIGGGAFQNSLAARVTWDAMEGVPALVRMFPSDSVFPDVSDFTVLTFRILQTNNTEKNGISPDFNPIDLSAVLFDTAGGGGQWTVFQPDFFGALLPGTAGLAVQPAQHVPLDVSPNRTEMRTIRIPLIRFRIPTDPDDLGETDMSSVEEILLGFSRDMSGEVIVDSIAFEKADDDLAACGNGVVDGLLEVCDFDEQGNVRYRFGDPVTCGDFFGDPDDPESPELGCLSDCSYDFSVCD